MNKEVHLTEETNNVSVIREEIPSKVYKFDQSPENLLQKLKKDQRVERAKHSLALVGGLIGGVGMSLMSSVNEYRLTVDADLTKSNTYLGVILLAAGAKMSYEALKSVDKEYDLALKIHAIKNYIQDARRKGDLEWRDVVYSKPRDQTDAVPETILTSEDKKGSGKLLNKIETFTPEGFSQLSNTNPVLEGQIEMFPEIPVDVVQVEQSKKTLEKSESKKNTSTKTSKPRTRRPRQSAAKESSSPRTRRPRLREVIILQTRESIIRDLRHMAWVKDKTNEERRFLIEVNVIPLHNCLGENCKVCKDYLPEFI